MVEVQYRSLFVIKERQFEILQIKFYVNGTLELIQVSGLDGCTSLEWEKLSFFFNAIAGENVELPRIHLLQKSVKNDKFHK